MIIVLVIIGLSLVILVHEAGHFIVAKLSGITVLEFGIGFPPRLFGALRRREREVDEVVPATKWLFFFGKPGVEEAERAEREGATIYSVNWLPFGGFVRMQGEDGSPEAGEDAAMPVKTSAAKSVPFANVSFWKKAATLAAGVSMNVIFGWLILFAVFLIGTPQHLMIAEVLPDSPAAAAGLTSEDVILSARLDATTLADPVSSDALIALVRSSGEKPIRFEVKRGDAVRTVEIAGKTNAETGAIQIGVSLSDAGLAPLPFHSALWKSIQATGETLVAVVAGFWYLVTRVFTTPEVLKSVAGPVGIVNMAVQSGSLGLIYILQFLALISLNLAVLNLIPFPALDGGRILLTVIEKVFGRPLPRRFQTAVNAIGFVALILLMVVVTVQDIGKL